MAAAKHSNHSLNPLGPNGALHHPPATGFLLVRFPLAFLRSAIAAGGRIPGELIRRRFTLDQLAPHLRQEVIDLPAVNRNAPPAATAIATGEDWRVSFQEKRFPSQAVAVGSEGCAKFRVASGVFVEVPPAQGEDFGNTQMGAVTKSPKHALAKGSGWELDFRVKVHKG